MKTLWNVTIKGASGEAVCPCDGTKTLLEIIRDAGVDFLAPCGGNGTCGKCRVHACGQLTPPTQKELSVLSAQELADGVRLACLCKPTGDVNVDLSRQKKSGSVIREEGGLVQAQCDPTVKQVEIHPAKACLERQISMQKRICEALAAEGVTVCSVDADCLKQLPSVLAQQSESYWAVVDGDRLLEVSAEKQPVLGVAVDIGTTTVVAYLYDLTTGRQLGVRSQLSAQKAFGSDVISRIKCATEQGTEPLRNAAVGQLNELIRLVCGQTAPCRVMKMAVCGNPTMQHLLCGLSPETIAAAPFETVSDFGACIPAEALDISIHAGANVYVLPSISGYVGGDITAGVIACGMDSGEDVRLMLDIGTNGEMALATPDGIYYCATAAGPAFEGAHIEDGVGGITGAISSVKAQDGTIRISTVGDAAPVGICGSGIIDAVAALLDIEAVDETGRLCDSDEYDEPYCSMLDEDEGKFILDPATGIGITGKDLREVQLAKAAIAAGIQTLLHHAGLKEKDVKAVYLAGGFGSYISKESSCRIGLLPASLLDRIVSVGNSAGCGAALALLDHKYEAVLARLAREGRYIELSAYPFFNDSYIENMMFE